MDRQLLAHAPQDRRRHRGAAGGGTAGAHQGRGRGSRALEARFGNDLGDLGQAILAELAETYTKARRTFLAWYELSEREFDLRKAATETRTTTEMASSFSEVLHSSSGSVATMKFNHHTQRTEQFQEAATLVAAILLVPTLVAGIFGANTALPGGGDWVGFELMFGAMVVGAVTTFVVLSSWRKRSKDATVEVAAGPR